MTTIQELNPHNFKTSAIIDKNLMNLFIRLNELQCAWGKDIVLTSGLRNSDLQQKLIDEGRTHATHSAHLSGCAADISDPSGYLATWIMERLSLMEKIGLWVEDPHYTPTWLHVQIYAPLSMKRVFIP